MFRFFLLATLVLVALTGYAQQQPNNGGPIPDAPVNGAPIDGGLSLLLAGGAVVAVRRLRQRRHAR